MVIAHVLRLIGNDCAKRVCIDTLETRKYDTTHWSSGSHKLNDARRLRSFWHIREVMRHRLLAHLVLRLPFIGYCFVPR